MLVTCVCFSAIAQQSDCVIKNQHFDLKINVKNHAFIIFTILTLLNIFILSNLFLRILFLVKQFFI